MKKIIVFIVSTATVLSIAFLIIFSVMKSYSEQSLSGVWTRTEQADNKFMLVKHVLEINDSTISYSKNSFLTSDNISSFSYRLVSPSVISVNGKKYRFEFNSDKSMLTFTPGLTNGKEKERWFQF